ncbi:hypothetical protein, partial [uncultured Alteromonas sp.]|uniref:hypothetical protein n=1 Tax=uncultured Alteromonas sp. TaxID=179113 RepID=UPI0030DD76ED
GVRVEGIQNLPQHGCCGRVPMDGFTACFECLLLSLLTLKQEKAKRQSTDLACWVSGRCHSLLLSLI